MRRIDAKTFLYSILRDERGATAVEYGLIVAMIFLAMVSALTGLSQESKKTWTKVSTDMSNSTKQAANAV